MVQESIASNQELTLEIFVMEKDITFGEQRFRIVKAIERRLSPPPSSAALLPMPIPWFKLGIECLDHVPVELNISIRGAL